MKTPSSILAAILIAPTLAAAADYEWTFNDGSLTDFFNNGTMAPVGATVPNIVFTDGGAIPHIGGVPARVLNVPAITNPLDGFVLAFDATGGNGGSAAYINQYTFIFDVYSPGGPNWQALFNTDPSNGNDADWYIAPDNALGIGALGYSAPGAVAQNAWQRIAFAADLGAGEVKFYINGGLAFTRTGASLFDGRFALYSNVDGGADVRLFNEGDGSGVYTHDLLVNSVAFVDRKMTDGDLAALGGPNADGILVPEPAAGLLGLLGLAGMAARRRRR